MYALSFDMDPDFKEFDCSVESAKLFATPNNADVDTKPDIWEFFLSRTVIFVNFILFEMKRDKRSCCQPISTKESDLVVKSKEIDIPR